MQEPDIPKQTKQPSAVQSSQVPPAEEQWTQHTSACCLKDHVDWVIAGWEEERSDLDVAPIAVITRLERLQSYLRAEIATLFERFGLTGPSFAVIATLRRAGTPYQLSQRALMDALQLTGGTVSVRIDRLERDGIVERLPDPHDQRGVLVRLTEKGERLFDQVAPLHLANEDRLLSALTAQQREQLAALLRILLLSFDPIAPEDPHHPSRWIAASLAPAHRARKIRRSSGLPDIPGLLVQSVAVPGPAASAGLREGDLIISANKTEIRSIESLYEQLLAARGEALELEVLRGAEPRSVSLYAGEPPAGE
ncbi:MAG TPA: MarR family transcriptional regulator [Ktedonobacteraceae bacterium]|nr:MarR family transcriptional regulator [Ktedonobacteraceae bacterium]